MELSELPANELARICGDAGNNEAWLAFQARFRRHIVVAVTRVAKGYGERAWDSCDDLVQLTYARICRDNCRLLREFRPEYEDSIIPLVQSIATKTAHDFFRKASRQKRSSICRWGVQRVEDLLNQAGDDGIVDWMDRHVLFWEIVRLLDLRVGSTELGRRDEEIFLLYFQWGFTLAEIADMPGVQLGTRGVEASLRRTRAALCKALHAPARRDQRKT